MGVSTFLDRRSAMWFHHEVVMVAMAPSPRAVASRIAVPNTRRNVECKAIGVGSIGSGGAHPAARRPAPESDAARWARTATRRGSTPRHSRASPRRRRCPSGFRLHLAEPPALLLPQRGARGVQAQQPRPLRLRHGDVVGEAADGERRQDAAPDAIPVQQAVVQGRLHDFVEEPAGRAGGGRAHACLRPVLCRGVNR
jgi:hypothetical protein